MKPEDNIRTRLIIAVSVAEQCNAEKLPSEATFWFRFKELFSARVPNVSDSDILAIKSLFTA